MAVTTIPCGVIMTYIHMNRLLASLHLMINVETTFLLLRDAIPAEQINEEWRTTQWLSFSMPKWIAVVFYGFSIYLVYINRLYNYNADLRENSQWETWWCMGMADTISKKIPDVIELTDYEWWPVDSGLSTDYIISHLIDLMIFKIIALIYMLLFQALNQGGRVQGVRTPPVLTSFLLKPAICISTQQ